MSCFQKASADGLWPVLVELFPPKVMPSSMCGVEMAFDAINDPDIVYLACSKCVP